MIIKHHEQKSELSLEEIELNISLFSKLVKFGPGDVYNSKHEKFSEPWLGEYNKHSHEFKLFKTAEGTENTSEFCIKGQLFARPDHTWVRYSLNIHYSMLIAAASLNVFVLAVVVLAKSKGLFDSHLFTIAAFIAVNALYGFSKLKDLRQSENEFKKLLTHKPRVEEEVEVEEDI